MKKFNSLMNDIKYTYLEYFSYILLIIWSISPIVEYILKNYLHFGYTIYFVFAIYFVGIFSLIEYIIYIYKKIKDKELNIKKIIPYILIFILLIISIISSIHSGNYHLSFFGEGYRKEGLIVYIMYIGFILSASIIENKKYIKNIFKIIIISALFIIVMSFFQDDFSYKNPNIYFQFNHYGYFLMINTMLAGFMFVKNIKIKKIIYLLIYIFFIYILIRNDTFGCFFAVSLSLIFSFIYSMITKYKRLDIIILVVTFIASSFLISHFDIRIGEKVNSNNTQEVVSKNISSLSKDVKTIISSDEKSETNKIGTGRGLLWKTAWDFTLEHPIFGGGMESLNAYYKALGIMYNDRPHNIILQFTSFIGIPGAIIYIILILYLAIINLKNLKKNIINYMIYVTAMCYFISSMFGNTMFYTSPYFVILLGFLIGMNFNSDRQDNSKVFSL